MADGKNSEGIYLIKLLGLDRRPQRAAKISVVDMRVLRKNLRGEEGEISLIAESLDDLWHLKHLVSPGDLVFSTTQRKISGATDKIRPEKAERRTVRLGITVEAVEFHTYSNWLRIHGVIRSGVDIGSYHTLNIEIGSEISIIKRWHPSELQRIEEAVAESNRPKVVIALIEEGEATIGVLRQFGVQTAAEIRGGSGKGSGTSARDEFLRTVAEQIVSAAGDDAYVILAGPGFAKEDLRKVLEIKYPDILKRLTMDDVSSTGRSGFQEVLRRGVVDRIAETCRISRETKLIDDLMKEIATDGRAAYGIKEVEAALNYGAIEILMVLDKLARKDELDALIRDVSKGRGRVVIFSSEFEPGERLEALGGVAALLRFKLPKEVIQSR